MTADAYQRESVDRGIQDDGRRLWVFTQSKLKQVDVCPERGRRQMLGLMPDFATDSTALGHGVHLAIEMSITDMIDSQGPMALTDMVDIGIAEFDQIMAEPSSKFVKAKRPETSHAAIQRCLTAWWTQVMPTLRPVAVEVKFGPSTIWEDEHRIIQLEGRIDYIDELGLADWKTAGREWVEWEHKRWDVQPTVYTWGWCPLAQEDCTTDHPWTWHVFNTDGSYQRIETTRDANDWDWLQRRCVVIAHQLEAELEEWHKNDTSALCSPKYCGAWAVCKGAFMGPHWPNG